VFLKKRVEPFNKLQDVIVKNLPERFEAGISYDGLGYIVTHTLYPAGYHYKPIESIPLVGIASQKKFIRFYHMGIYSDPKLLNWLVSEYPKHSPQKLDMGKGCVRFKKMDDLHYKLIRELMKEMRAQQWIDVYEENILPKSKKKTHTSYGQKT
jgi:hypothetical protein